MECQVDTGRLVKAEWATTLSDKNSCQISLIRELMAYHCLCLYCCRLTVDQTTGKIEELHTNSALHWSRHFEWPWAILNSELEPEHVVLDAGGGPAVLQYALARRCGKVVNVDLDPQTLRAVEVMKNGVGCSNIETMQGDICKLPFTDDHFDRVFLVSVAEHIKEWQACVTEMFRVLKPRGIFILTFDVERNDPKDENNFYINLKDVPNFLAKYGGTIPRGQNVLCNIFPSGSSHKISMPHL